MNSLHKWPVTRKWFHLKTSSWLVNYFCWYRWQCLMNSEDTRICTFDKIPWNKYTYFVCVVHKSDTRYLNKRFVLDISISCPWCYLYSWGFRQCWIFSVASPARYGVSPHSHVATFQSCNRANTSGPHHWPLCRVIHTWPVFFHIRSGNVRVESVLPRLLHCRAYI